MRRLFALGFLLLGLAPAVASAKPAVSLKLAGAYVQKGADGTIHLVPVSAQQGRPGDRIRWDLGAANGGDSPAFGLTPVDKIQPGCVYVPGSAAATGARAEYSLDNGKTWSASPTVPLQTPSGPQVRKADPARYTADPLGQRRAAQAGRDGPLHLRGHRSVSSFSTEGRTLKTARKSARAGDRCGLGRTLRAARERRHAGRHQHLQRRDRDLPGRFGHQLHHQLQHRHGGGAERRRRDGHQRDHRRRTSRRTRR